MASLWAFSGLTLGEVARRVWRQVVRDDAVGRSAQLSYFFLFSLFPLLFFLFSLIGYFTESGPELRASLFQYLRAVVPAKAHVLIRDTLDEITRESSGGKTFFGLLAALWFASYGVG